MEMSLNDLQLNDDIIARLYSHSLVETEMIQAREKKSSFSDTAVSDTAIKINYLGTNEKRVAIVVSNPDHAFLPEDHLAFLVRMLAACNMSMGDVAIVNNRRGDIRIDQVIRQLQPEKIILAGTDPQALEITISIPEFTLQPFENSVYLFVPPIEQLIQEIELKTKLWNCLRQLFDIKSK